MTINRSEKSVPFVSEPHASDNIIPVYVWFFNREFFHEVHVEGHHNWQMVNDLSALDILNSTPSVPPDSGSHIRAIYHAFWGDDSVNECHTVRSP